MLPWLADDAIVLPCARGSAIRLAFGRSQTRGGPSAMRNAQMLLTGLALAAWHKSRPPCRARAIAGYSVGELAAFSAAGVFDAQCALNLSGLRAERWTGVPNERRRHARCRRTRWRGGGTTLQEHRWSRIAIRIGTRNVVLGGRMERSIRPRALPRTRARAARDCGSAVASHTPWMHEAAEDFMRTLSAASLPRAANGLVQQCRRPGTRRCRRQEGAVDADRFDRPLGRMHGEHPCRVA
jgi:[acyl-carrier-protein] S-malonyltransferase